MLCPKCRTDLAERRAGDGAIYLCSRCDGIWLADATLRQYLRMTVAAQGTGNKILSLIETAPISTELSCPVCEDTYLEELKYRAVEVDRCADCRGIFLDAGEISRIEERLLRAQREAAKLGSTGPSRGADRQPHSALGVLAEAGLPEALALAAIAMLGD